MFDFRMSFTRGCIRPCVLCRLGAAEMEIVVFPYTYVSSRHNPTVMLAASLSEKKARERLGLFRFDGKKLFSEACACGARIEYIFILESRFSELSEFVIECIEKNNTSVAGGIIVLSEAAFSKICEEKSPEGVITVAKYIDKIFKIATIDNKAEKLAYDALAASNKITAFESLRDPGNLGTMIRTAAALGTDTLILSSDCADVYNPKTVRAAMGAIFTRRILIADDMPAVVGLLRSLGRRTVAAALTEDAADARSLGLCSRDCVIIGNEGHGLTEKTIRACDAVAMLPMERGPGIESLNAASAAAIFMWLCL